MSTTAEQIASNVSLAQQDGADALTLRAVLDLLGSMAAVLSASEKSATQQMAVNPNLFAVAAVLYGDATKWQAIADASGMTDPQPTGVFLLSAPRTP